MCAKWAGGEEVHTEEVHTFGMHVFLCQQPSKRSCDFNIMQKVEMHNAKMTGRQRYWNDHYELLQSIGKKGDAEALNRRSKKHKC